MKIKKVNLDIVIGVTSKIPETALMEAAFAGRSNVGKSSLINALMNRKSYARTSAQPGKTQTINYYNINDELYLVDLPGYGYTKASVKVREQWGRMVERYLHGSKKLEKIFLLVDGRHKPTQNDKIMYNWIIENGFRPVIVATKADKLKKSEREKNKKIIRDELDLESDDVLLLVSAAKKEGIDELWSYICTEQ